MREFPHSSDALRDELIGPTVRAAKAGSMLYKARFDGIDLDTIQTTSDLARLPVLSKADVRSAGFKMLCDGQAPSHVQNTSGSTGEPLLLFRSQEEGSFIRAFFGYITRVDNLSGDKPIVLALTIPHHGTPTPIPGHAFVLHTAVNDDELLEQTIVLLSKSFHLSGVEEHVSVIVGSVSQLFILTNYILERRRSDLAKHIRLIEITGDYITPRWRVLLANVWGARINDRFSLAEIFGGALFCERCHGYHFDAHVVPEVVELGKNAVASDDVVGELVLTSLFPFVQFQPFIRYLTGDMFSRTDRSCWEISYEFRGRTAHALFDPRDPSILLIDGRTVFDAVDVASAARALRYNDVTVARYKRAASKPICTGRVEVAGEKLHVTLLLELAYTPGLFGTATVKIQQEITEEILSKSKKMKDAVEKGEVIFRVDTVAPGSLSSVAKESRLWIVS